MSKQAVKTDDVGHHAWMNALMYQHTNFDVYGGLFKTCINKNVWPSKYFYHQPSGWIGRRICDQTDMISSLRDPSACVSYDIIMRFAYTFPGAGGGGHLLAPVTNLFTKQIITQDNLFFGR